MHNEKAVKAIIAEIGHSVQEGIEALAERYEPVSLAEWEEELLQLRKRVDMLMLKASALALGSGRCGSELPCECGGRLRLVGNRPKRILTLLGTLPLKRAYYHCASCGRSRVPLDERLAVGNDRQSLGVKQTTLLVCALMPNGRAMDLLGELGIPHVSEKESQRIVRELGGAVVAERDREADLWRREHTTPVEHIRGQVPERLAVLMDGTMAHTDGAWHEGKVGTFYVFDEDGEAVGEKGCVATFRGIEHFRALWDTEAQRWHMAEAKHVVALCDGGPWTWNTVAECCPAHTFELLDFYHAAEHLGSVANAIWGEGSERGGEWVEEQKERLLEGRLDAFFEELGRWAKAEKYREAVEPHLGYFERNRARLRYREALARGYPISSGVVEAACKTIIGLREKQPGMRWRGDTAEIIAHLRCIYYSGRWSAFRRRWLHKLAKTA